MSKATDPGWAWVQSWQRAGRRLSELRKAELEVICTEQALLRLAGAFESCRLRANPGPTSGLVEQQRWFRKVRPLCELKEDPGIIETLEILRREVGT